MDRINEVNEMEVIDKIRNGVYENKLIFPRKQDFMIYKKCEYCGSKYKDKEEEKKYTVAKLKYRHEDAAMLEKLKQDLIREAGIEGHPKADTLWNLAYGQGHSAGFQEIHNQFFELLDLVK